MWAPDGRSEQYGHLASVFWLDPRRSGRSTASRWNQTRGTLFFKCFKKGDEQYLFALSGIRNQWGELVHVPVLQEVLGILDLVLCPCDGDDAVLRAL